MKQLLEKYFQKQNPYLDFIEVDYFDADGSVCTGTYYTDKEHNYQETFKLNIWEILIFVRQEIRGDLP